MKKFTTLFFIFLSVSAGCTQAIKTETVEEIGSIPKLTYTAYLYSSGAGERYRAVFLKNPESAGEVVPASSQIVQTAATFDDAMAFMQRGVYKKVNVQSVQYLGKPVGYLLTHIVPPLRKEYLEVNVYSKGGKIYFSAWEKMYD